MVDTAQSHALTDAIGAAKAGNSLIARLHLERAASENNNDPNVWLWLAWTAESPRAAIMFLEEALDRDPKNEAALAGLQWARKLDEFDPPSQSSTDSTKDPAESKVAGIEGHPAKKSTVVEDVELAIDAIEAAADSQWLDPPEAPTPVADDDQQPVVQPENAEQKSPANEDPENQEAKQESSDQGQIGLAPAAPVAQDRQPESTTQLNDDVRQTAPFPFQTPADNAAAEAECPAEPLELVDLEVNKPAQVDQSANPKRRPPAADRPPTATVVMPSADRRPGEIPKDDSTPSKSEPADNAPQLPQHAPEQSEQQPPADAQPAQSAEDEIADNLVLDVVECGSDPKLADSLSSSSTEDDAPWRQLDDCPHDEFICSGPGFEEPPENPAPLDELAPTSQQPESPQDTPLEGIPQTADVAAPVDAIEIEALEPLEAEIELFDAEPVPVDEAESEENVDAPPEAENVVAAEPVAEVKPPVEPLNPSLVMVIDPSATVRQLVAVTFEKRGYDVLVAGDKPDLTEQDLFDAIAAARPAVVLLEAHVGGVDGRQLCKKIKKHEATADTHVVLVSGKEGLLDKLRGKLGGGDDFLAKPFSPVDLANKAEPFLKKTELQTA